MQFTAYRVDDTRLPDLAPKPHQDPLLRGIRDLHHGRLANTSSPRLRLRMLCENDPPIH